MTAPLSRSYNLARLGNAGDSLRFEAGEEERAAIAAFAGALSLSAFAAQVELKRISASRFVLDFRLEAEVTQACVATLQPVVSRIDSRFRRELHFGGGRRPPGPQEGPGTIDLTGQDLDAPEAPDEIDSLHYDLAGPTLEEFLLALDPYPRCPGVAFQAEEKGEMPPDNPFAVLKSLKPSK